MRVFCARQTTMNTATASAIFTRDGDAARDFAAQVDVGMVGYQRADPGADRLLYLWRLEALGFRRSQPARPGRDPLLYRKTKTVTSRWPSGVKDGAEFVIPTMR